ncbi:MAG: PilN domain-containing protein [Dehalococcoidales bacterium]|jgi:type IV pilus assembly protein PilM
MANNSTSIYINDTSIRLMVTRGRRITKLADMPLDIGLADIDTPEKENQLAEKISFLLKSNKVNEKKIILGISGLHCLTRPVILPELPRPMVKEAITREARRVLPVPLEQLYISWQIVSTTQGKIQAFLVAMPRQIADMVMRVFAQAGCKPYLMDIKPLALARLAKESTALIVDVQSKEFDIIIMQQGMPQPIRTVSFPQESLPTQEKLDMVKEDVKRTVQFFNSNNNENQIQPGTTMYVSGEMADETDIYESLAHDLGFTPVLLTSPLKCIKQLDPSRYLVNAGLALKEIYKEGGVLLPNFNTLPEPYLPKQVPMSRLMAIPATGIAIGIIILLTVMVQNAAADINTAQSQLQNTQFILEKKQSDKKTILQAITDTQAQLTDAEQAYQVYSSALKSLNKTGELMNTDIGATVDNMVPDLYLEAVNHNGGELSINGKASTEQEVLEFVRNLEDTGRFSEITIASIKLSEDEEETYVDYSLTCILEENRN